MDPMLAAAPRRFALALGPDVVCARLSAWPAARGIVVIPRVTGVSCNVCDAVELALENDDLARLSVDLLTPDERRLDARMGHLRFDVPLLAARFRAALAWIAGAPALRGLAVGCFATSTAAAAVLEVAAVRGCPLRAIVTVDGRADLAHAPLRRVRAATRLVVGSYGQPLVDLNRDVYQRLRCEKQLAFVHALAHPSIDDDARAAVVTLARTWLAPRCVPDALSAPARARRRAPSPAGTG